MDLFSNWADPKYNFLPYGGIVNYYGVVFHVEKANHFFNKLLSNIEWKNDEAIVFGKKIITKRKVAWYGDKEFEYSYSNTTKHALPWTKELMELKKVAQDKTKENYNSCLLNLYHSGNEGVTWHSDGEKDLKKNGAIASMSFGAERKFSFKHKKTLKKVDLKLAHGSLLVMKGETQDNWLHCVPKSKIISQPRVSLTFRTIVL